MGISAFYDNIDSFRSWRKLELSSARSLAEQYRGRVEEGYLCRSWVMMIYAHCDQALKEISKEYLSFLADHPRDDYDYRTPWMIYFGKEAAHHVSVRRYTLCSDASPQTKAAQLSGIKGDEVFKSGNFKYSRLRFFMEWIVQARFDHQKYKGFCDTLKEKRDMIAHGELYYIKGVDDCLSWHLPAINLIDELCEVTMSVAETHCR